MRKRQVEKEKERRESESRKQKRLLTKGRSEEEKKKSEEGKVKKRERELPFLPTCFFFSSAALPSIPSEDVMVRSGSRSTLADFSNTSASGATDESEPSTKEKTDEASEIEGMAQ